MKGASRVCELDVRHSIDCPFFQDRKSGPVVVDIWLQISVRRLRRQTPAAMLLRLFVRLLLSSTKDGREYAILLLLSVASSGSALAFSPSFFFQLEKFSIYYQTFSSLPGPINRSLKYVQASAIV